MKPQLLGLAFLVGSTLLTARGTVVLGNCTVCPRPDPLKNAAGALLNSPDYVLALYWGPANATPEDLVPVGPTLNIVNGCWQSGELSSPPGVAAGGLFAIQARAWETRGGSVLSWADTVLDCTLERGVSALTLVQSTGVVFPPPPPVTVCIPGFTLARGECQYGITIPPDGAWHPVANACHDPVTIHDLIPTPPLGAAVLLFDNASHEWVLNVAASPFPPFWWDASMMWQPGAGGFVMNPGAQPLALEFHGPTCDPSLPLPWTTGCILVCRQSGAPAGFEGITGYPPQSDTAVYVSNPATGGYTTHQYTDLLGWEPSEPMPNPGILVWICKGAGPQPFPSVCLYTLHVPSGISTLANQCANDQRVASLLPGMPPETRLWKFDNASRRWSFNEFLQAWSNPEQTLAPGEGAFLANPSAAFDIVIGGWANTPQLPLPYCTTPGAGSYLVSRQNPAPAEYADIMGCAPTDGTMVARWNEAAQRYDVYTFSIGDWMPDAPIAEIGEAVWVLLGGGTRPDFGCPLTIALDPTASNVTVCWPCEGCHLQESSSLAPPAWKDLPGGPCVTRPTSGTNMFFRVVCP
ncbi:MAG TPA: hypothetical protein PKM73_20115 [Verrucomicrobiota bacterium]|nr:hypothetical protein [Verrucomicrobiota bacterium]HNU51508.1 hypothetical protein [Verrucomicrobiota bacterium]